MIELRKNKTGFTLVEMLITTAIMASVVAGAYVIMASGESAWYTTEVRIRLSENLRRVVDKVSRELKESGSDVASNMQVVILDGAGPNNSDVLRFAMPIICEAGGSIINATGDVANWGAPLTWGCLDSTCMDVDNDCLTRDYQWVEYRVNNNNQLVRRVLDPALVSLREDIFGSNITDFQTTLSADQNVVTLVFTGQLDSALNRTLTSSRTANVLLRNRG